MEGEEIRFFSGLFCFAVLSGDSCFFAVLSGERVGFGMVACLF